MNLVEYCYDYITLGKRRTIEPPEPDADAEPWRVVFEMAPSVYAAVKAAAADSHLTPAELLAHAVRRYLRDLGYLGQGRE